jgi:arylsulfatase A-like enzyme
MKNKTLIKSSITVVSSAILMYSKAEQRPNVLLLFADDLGWTDLGCYGSSFYETPHLDQLAKDGMLFTNAYAACPVSSPTRVSLQTGRYPVRTGVTDWIKGRYHQPDKREEMQKIAPVLPPDNVFNMPLEEVTIAEVLNNEGYQTAFIGKWHCAEDSIYFPQYQGYDINIGGCGKGGPGPNGYFVPYNNPYIKDGPEGEYLTDRLGDECVKVLNQFKDKPFFINFCFYQVHTPLIGKPDKVRYYEKKAKMMGLDTVRTYDENPAWKAKQPFQSKSYRERLVQSHAVYAAMVSSMDDNVGKVIAELKRLGLYDNTIIIFSADNGGLSTAEGSPTCNYPLRGGKGHLYEGGIREPLIVTWKNKIAGNSVSDCQVTTVDYFPTILELAGVKIPEELTIDGISIKPALTGKSQQRGAMYWHYPHYPNQGSRPGGVIRDGDYKLIEFYDTGEKELYNLKEDIGETTNLAKKKPQTVQELGNKLNHWRVTTGAKMPVRNTEFKVQ